ncbi:MAG: effector binding domain-containing protein [Candidatus Azobacteroides sp.]|nr:effector binding domain-containing protein [Candidatus Azobacteroides sp.]
MAEDKPRLARLTAIITQLQAKQIVTATEIAKKFNISVRTVYRDIRTLEESGIPITTEEGRGYSVMEGFRLPPVMFTEEEANAIVTAELLVLKNKDTSFVEHFQRAVTKIKATLQYNQKTKTEFLFNRIQVRDNKENENTSDYLMTLQAAISDFRLVKINYLSLENQQSERVTEPFALYTTHSNWILIAFCRKRNDFRAFRLDCITTLKVLHEYFEPHKITLEQYLEECRKKFIPTPDIPLSQDKSTFAGNHIKKNNMEKVQVKPFCVVGISVKTTNENNQGAKDIPELWQKFMDENVLEKIPNKVDHTIYCIYTDYEGDHTKPYVTFLGCKVENLDHIPQGLTGRKFDGGNYLKFSAKGNLAEGLVIKEWIEIWNMDLDRGYTADFEVFGKKAQNPENAEIDFYIAVK